MTRTPEDIATLFAFGRWANDQTLRSVEGLSMEELGRPVGGSFGSVLGTLVHLYGADWVWLERWHRKSPRALPGAEEIATLDALAGRWRPVEEGMRIFAESLTAERMAEPLTYVSFKEATPSPAPSGRRSSTSSTTAPITAARWRRSFASSERHPPRPTTSSTSTQPRSEGPHRSQRGQSQPKVPAVSRA